MELVTETKTNFPNSFDVNLDRDDHSAMFNFTYFVQGADSRRQTVSWRTISGKHSHALVQSGARQCPGALGPMGTENSFPGVKRSKLEADQSFPSKLHKATMAIFAVLCVSPHMTNGKDVVVAYFI
jgi:hypothetical protein